MVLIYNPGESKINVVPVRLPRWFDWGAIERDRTKYAHMLIANKTGGGKSTLAMALAKGFKSGNELAIAVAPHWQTGDFGTADLIVGSGRNYGVSAEEYEEKELKNGDVKVTGEVEVPFREILGGRRVTVCQFMRSLMNEMNERYQLVDGVYRSKAENRPYLTVFLDEYPAYATMPGVAECLKQLIRESRKVGIRLFILTQGTEVKTLGIEGEGSIRENLTFIRLGEWAIAHAHQLLNQQKAGSETYNFWLHALNIFNESDKDGKPLRRAAMIDDEPCIVPDLTDYLGLNTAKTTVAKPAVPTEPTEVVMVETTEHFMRLYPRLGYRIHIALALSVLYHHEHPDLLSSITDYTGCTNTQARIALYYAVRLLGEPGLYERFCQDAPPIKAATQETDGLISAIEGMLTPGTILSARKVQDRLRKRSSYPGCPAISEVRESFEILAKSGRGCLEIVGGDYRLSQAQEGYAENQ